MHANRHFNFWLLIALLGLSGCGVELPEFTNADKLSAADRDCEAADAIAKKDVAEARAWLAVEKGHVVWKGDRAAIKQLVEDLYAAGVPQVYAVGTSSSSDNQVVAEFMAELPSDTEARARVFRAAEIFWRNYLSGNDPAEIQAYIDTDLGQRFLIFNFDL